MTAVAIFLAVASFCCLLATPVPVHCWQTDAELLEKGAFRPGIVTQSTTGDVLRTASSTPSHQFSRRALLHVPRLLLDGSSKNGTGVGNLVQVFPEAPIDDSTPPAFTVHVGNLVYSNCTLNETLVNFNGSILAGQDATEYTRALDELCTGLPPKSSSSGFPNATIGNFTAPTFTVHVGKLVYSNCTLNETLIAFNGSMFVGQNATNYTGAVNILCTGLPSKTSSSVFPKAKIGNSSSPAFTVHVGNMVYSNCTLNETLTAFNGSMLAGQNATNHTRALNILCPVLPPKPSSSGFPGWAIAVIVAGVGVVVLLVACFLVWRLCFRKRKSDSVYINHYVTKNERMLLEPEILCSVPIKGGNEAIRESDLQPQKYLSTAESAAQAVRKLAQEVLARARADARCAAALLQLVRSRGLPQEAALAVVEELCARTLLRNFENPGLQDGEFRTSMSSDERRAHFRGVHDQVVYGTGVPPGFDRYLGMRKAELLRRFAKKLGLTENETSEVLFPQDVIPHVDRAALGVYAVNAGAFAFQRPAYLLWAKDPNADPDWFRSTNPRVETGEVGVSVFPAVVITENQLTQGKVFAV